MVAKSRKFSKENWRSLVKSMREQDAQEPAPEPKKEDAKVEVHVHVSQPQGFQGNGADRDLEKMLGDNRGRWLS